MSAQQESYNLFQECKRLARSIKSQRLPPPFTVRHEYGQQRPARDVADQLFGAYLRTFETVYRIFHVPSLKAEYDRFWQPGLTATDRAVVIQLQLCMSIGACFYDDTFSLRRQAIQWVYEARSWLNYSSQKSKLTVTGIQTMCLLHIARQTAGIESDFVWISAGSLVRTAISIGLHIDPANLPTMSSVQSETRRRLWTTILELTVESSLDSGMSPTLSLEDISCNIPSNVNDSQLSESESGSRLTPLPNEVFTEASAQIALSRSFALRLAIAKSVNRFGVCCSYGDTIRLNAELTTACRELDACMRTSDAEPSATSFQAQFCNLVVRRYFLALNIPYMTVAPRNPMYAFSQKFCVDTALRLFYGGVTFSSVTFGNSDLARLQSSDTSERGSADFSRLLYCGAGPFRAAPMQATMVIARELINCAGDYQARSLKGLELHLMLQVAVEWTQRRLRAGDTNVKDHSFVSLALAFAEKEAGFAPAKTGQTVHERYREALKVSRELLRGIISVDATQLNGEYSLGTVPLHGIENFWMNEMVDFDWDGIMD
jgi:hypothetical protein